MSNLQPGIYRIVNGKTGRLYIGSSKNAAARLAHHQYDLKRGKHVNRHLQHSWNKHGSSYFEFEVLVVCQENIRIITEQWWIDFYRACRIPLYNLKPSAESRTGFHFRFSEATRRHWSEIRKGRRLSLETRAKMSASRKGLPKSLDYRIRMSERMKGVPQLHLRGRIFSAEHRARLSIAKKGVPNYALRGRQHTPERCEKMRQSMIGKNQGKYKGKQLAPEHRLKISLGQQAFHAKFKAAKDERGRFVNGQPKRRMP